MKLFQDIEISLRRIQSSVFPAHRHHYFELLYIVDGKGFHTINNNQYPYQKGNLFLLTPDDTHSFQVVDETTCCFIDFTKGLFSKKHRLQAGRVEISEFFVGMEYIFHNHQNLKGYIDVNTRVEHLTNALMMQLLTEKDNPDTYSSIITQNIVFLLLNIIARLIQENIAVELRNEGTKNIIHEIATYIQQHIYQKDLLRIENLA